MTMSLNQKFAVLFSAVVGVFVLGLVLVISKRDSTVAAMHATEHIQR